MSGLIAFGCGLLFAIGLGVGTMTDPARVIGFLDFFGDWDPTLAFVMGGALLVNAPAFRLTRRRGRPLCADALQLPRASGKISAQLLGGTALFGVGWGLTGYCPGPGLVGMGAGVDTAFAFAGAMVSGMLVWSMLQRRAPAVRPT
ncbi:MAG: DUF6691 family protein [Nannocystaceae bacterium]